MIFYISLTIYCLPFQEWASVKYIPRHRVIFKVSVVFSFNWFGKYVLWYLTLNGMDLFWSHHDNSGHTTTNDQAAFVWIKYVMLAISVQCLLCIISKNSENPGFGQTNEPGTLKRRSVILWQGINLVLESKMAAVWNVAAIYSQTGLMFCCERSVKRDAALIHYNQLRFRKSSQCLSLLWSILTLTFTMAAIHMQSWFYGLPMKKLHMCPSTEDNSMLQTVGGIIFIISYYTNTAKKCDRGIQDGCH